MTTSKTRHVALASAVALGAGMLLPLLVAPGAPAATAKVGRVCAKVGAKSGTLVCTRKAGKQVWTRAAAPTSSRATAPAAPAGTGAPAAAALGIEGAWKATPQSEAGYRVKEVLMGQDAEAVGRTNAVTGTLVIAGTKATSADVVVDVRTLKSPEAMRDGQVQRRILTTSQFPTATMKLAQPIDFGKVPADKETIATTAKVELTLRGTKKTVEVELQARRNGATIEVLGSVPVKFSEWDIPNPSTPLAKVGDDGTIEFLIVFGR